MAASLNRVTLIGNVGQDPDIRTTQSGSKIAAFSLATNESWTNRRSGERVERTEWHRVVVFNENLTEIVEQYVRKGDKVYVEGALRSREWTDNDGVKRYTKEITLGAFDGRIVLLGSSRGSGNEHAATAAGRTGGGNAARDGGDSEVPF